MDFAVAILSWPTGSPLIIPAAPEPSATDPGTIFETHTPSPPLAIPEIFQLCNLFLFLFFTLLQPLLRRKATQQTASGQGGSLQTASCVVQCLHAILFASRTTLDWSRHGLVISWPWPLLIRTLSCLAAVICLSDASWRTPSARRGIYNFCSCLTWSWLSTCAPYAQYPVDYYVSWIFVPAFFLDLFSSTTDERAPPSQTKHRGLFERLSFDWVNNIVFSPRTELQLENLPDVGLLADLDSYQERFLTTCETASEALLRKCYWGFLVKEHKLSLAVAFGLRLVEDIATFSIPLLLHKILQDPTMQNITIVFCLRTAGSISGCQSSYFVRGMGARYKSMLSAALHDKTLGMGDITPPGLADSTTLAEVDVQLVFKSTLTFLDIWTYPLQVVVCLGGLIVLLGWQGVLPVVVIMVGLLPATGMITSRITAWARRNMAAKDARTNFSNETFKSIQSIKLCGWEDAFLNILSDLRRKELQTLQGQALVNACLVCIMQSAPMLLTVASFLALIQSHRGLDSQLVFTSIMLFTMLNNAIIQTSGMLGSIQALRASMSRIQTYLLAPTASLAALAETEGRLVNGRHIIDSAGPIEWSPGSNLVTVGSFHYSAGSLSAVTGATGSGKSTFLLAILRHFEQQLGNLLGQTAIAYCPEVLFLTDGSIRDNILFGQPLDEGRYRAVVEACCLHPDFDRLPDGDRTVTQGSVALSGGQKARIALARAAYCDAHVYIFDNPLAAIDHAVQGMIVRRLLGPEGLLKDRIRFISSSQSLLLQQADWIHNLDVQPLRTEKGPAESRRDLCVAGQKTHVDVIEMETELSDASETDVATPFTTEHQAQDTQPEPEILEPPRSVLRHPVLRYMTTARPFGWPVTVGLLWLARLTSVVGVSTLRRLTTDATTTKLMQDIGLFAALSLAQTIFFFVFILGIYTLCIVPAADKLHSVLLSSLLSRPMEYFETAPIGHILNLLSNDLSRIDMSLNTSIIALIAQYTNLLIACGVLVFALPASISFVIPFIALYAWVQSLCQQALRDMRGLDAASRAPLLTHLQESRSGRVLFSLHGRCEDRVLQFREMLRMNLRALFPLACIELWLALRLDLLSVTLQTLAAGSMVFMGLDSNTMGFTLTYVFQVTTILGMLARLGAQFEADSVSLSRIHAAVGEESAKATYSKVPGFHLLPSLESQTLSSTDRPLIAHRAEADLPESWPSAGRVEFRNVSTRYRASLPPSLVTVTLDIVPSEKVAVIGRTGSGKSSFIRSLLGLMQEMEGHILIDGISSREVEGSRLRQSVSLIPQQPLVFTGSVRQNMDPRQVHTDKKILDALSRSAALKPLEVLAERRGIHYSILEQLLDLHVDPTGTFSGGELQLLALARAMLSPSKILILDEATSALDSAAEQHTQDILFTHFRDTTIIAIMHKIEYIHRYDRVLVLDEGRVVAFDTPAKIKAEGLYL